MSFMSSAVSMTKTLHHVGCGVNDIIAPPEMAIIPFSAAFWRFWSARRDSLFLSDKLTLRLMRSYQGAAQLATICDGGAPIASIGDKSQAK
jgi:hypothetical protein